MKRPLRVFLTVAAVAAVVAIAVSAAVSVWLSTWVPTHGKAWLEAELEQQGPLDVQIGSLRYSLWEGLRCEDVQATDRQTHTLWIRASSIRAQVGLLALLTHRLATYRIKAELDVPARATVTVDGQYGLRDKRGAVEVSSNSLSLETLSPLVQEQAKGLRGGTAVLKLRARWQPDVPPDVSGRLVITRLAWHAGTARAQGNLRVEGSLHPLPGSTRWVPELAGTVDQAVIDGIPMLGMTDEVSGSFRLSGDALTINHLAGRTAGVPWELDGAIGPLAAPSLDVRCRAQLDLSKTASQWLPNAQAWHPEGTAQAVVIARGPLRQWPAIDVMAAAEVTGASLTIPGFPHRLERLAGRVDYDHLTREVSINNLTGQVLDHQLSIQGTLQLAASPSLEALIQTEGAMPMTATISVTDLTDSPHVIGSVQFPQGSLQIDSRFHPDRVDIAQAELVIAQSHVRLTGRLGHAKTFSELQLHGGVELANLTQVPMLDLRALEPWALHGSVTLQSKLRGVMREWRDLEIVGSASARQVIIRSVPAQDAFLQWQQHAGVLMVKLAQATVGGGRLAGTWFAELHSEPVKLVADADLTGLDLAQMTASIPAWKARDIRGSASAHAEMSGFPRDQASWRGSGWVNMSGEQLGALPLLDRVFQGVFGALAERLGLAHLRRATLTKCSGQWRLAQTRIWTDDMQLSGTSGTEPLIILIRGSVGLDKTLDLTVEPDLSEQLVLEAPNTSTLSRAILRVVGGAERMRRMVGRHHVGGTVDKPEYKFEFNLEQLLNQVLPTGFGRLLESVR